MSVTFSLRVCGCCIPCSVWRQYNSQIRACLLLGKIMESLQSTPRRPMTFVMWRFKSDASVSMATEGLKQQTIKKRKQDDITVNITVNGLNSSSDHTSQQLHIRVFAKMLHTPYLTCENVSVNTQLWFHVCPLGGLSTYHTSMYIIVGCLSATLCLL